MRWANLAIVLATLAVCLLTVCLPGCDTGGPAAGPPPEIPSGAPPLPPGTSKEMTKGGQAARPTRPPG